MLKAPQSAAKQVETGHILKYAQQSHVRLAPELAAEARDEMLVVQTPVTITVSNANGQASRTYNLTVNPAPQSDVLALEGDWPSFLQKANELVHPYGIAFNDQTYAKSAQRLEYAQGVHAGSGLKMSYVGNFIYSGGPLEINDYTFRDATIFLSDSHNSRALVEAVIKAKGAEVSVHLK